MAELVAASHAQPIEATARPADALDPFGPSPISRPELLLAGATYELLAPLAVISWHLQLMRRRGARPELEIAVDALARLGLIIERLQLVFELESTAPRLSPLPLASLLETAVAARPPARLETPPPLTVRGNRQLLLLALDELLANALAHSPQPPDVTLSARRDGPAAVIEISDSGTGVASATPDGLFDCFARTDDARDRATGGAGLGLAIVRAVIRSHHGHCRLETRAFSPGTTGALRLPLVTADG